MEKGYGTSIDKKLVVALVIVCLALAAGFALIYLDLKADLASLQDSNANLSAEVQQLQGLVEALHINQTQGLSAVQIYNRTRFSVVLITNDMGDGSGAEGTGFVYDTQGHIITNNHVVEGAASITATFFDGSVKTAQIIGTPDVYSDLALLKVDGPPAQSQPLIIRNSSQLLVGEPVYAIGNPFGLSSSMTSGIVSQLGRVLKLSDLGVPPPEGDFSIADVIQFDAAVNPGNSGGPLLDSFGDVVGVTFAIETGQSNVTGFIGIGYAVPSALLMRVIPALNSAGHYDHPWVGISYYPRYTDGVHIATISSSGPADKAGLQAGDVIKKVGSLQVDRGEDFIIYLERYKSPGDQINLEINRIGVTITKVLTLEARRTS
jgi:S1-C subfamily serine protease